MDHSAGNTRIIPVEISHIDRNLFNSIDKRKLLANIVALYQQKGKGSMILSYADSDALQEYSKSFQTVNFEQEAILTLYQPGTAFYTTVQIAANIRQERTLSPSMRIVQAPQTPCSQPK